MTALKPARLVDPRPVKITLTLTPELHQSLVDYAAVGKKLNGYRERVPRLATFILAIFMARRELTIREGRDSAGALTMVNRTADTASAAKAHTVESATVAGRTSTFYSTSDLASYLKLSTGTLERMRATGNGPAFHKRGQTAFYSSSDVDKWLEGRRRY